MFHPIDKLTTTAIHLPIDNIDTDQIIPARFLKATTREGFGKNLFAEWRYDDQGNPNPGFVLNLNTRSAEILIAGKNFGCGSSREHAAWALYDYGFRVVMAPSFADIFRNNAMNNGILPIDVPEDAYRQLIRQITEHPDSAIHINLDCELVELPNTNIAFPITINSFKKKCLMEGLDLVGYMVAQKDQIIKFETTRV